MRDTQVWQRSNGNIVLRSWVRVLGSYLEHGPDNTAVAMHDTLPADAVPLVRADEARQVADRWVEWKAAHSDVFAETYEEGSDV